VPTLTDVQVWVDPAVTDTDKSDSHGIQADGISPDGTLYRLFSWESRTSPEDSLRRAIRKACELKASCVGVETDQGGDTWESVYDAAWDALVAAGEIPKHAPRILFRQAKAGAGHGPKSQRASQMLAAYERGEIVHVATGTQETLERGLRRYLLRKPFDLVDAAYYAWYGLTSDAPAVAASGIVQRSRWN
jgi:phage terminase large subunit-like protein